MDSATSADKVLSSFAAHQIQLVEWENNLLQRLSYPVVTSVSISTHLTILCLTRSTARI